MLSLYAPNSLRTPLEAPTRGTTHMRIQPIALECFVPPVENCPTANPTADSLELHKQPVWQFGVCASACAQAEQIKRAGKCREFRPAHATAHCRAGHSTKTRQHVIVQFKRLHLDRQSSTECAWCAQAEQIQRLQRVWSFTL